MGYFNKLSHAIIYFRKIEETRKDRVYGMMKLCFGSDEDAISQIMYCCPNGSKIPVWTLPSRDNVSGQYGILTGALGKEILDLVGKAAATFKVHLKPEDGKKEGRTWRITKNGIEEIKDQATTTTKS